MDCLCSKFGDCSFSRFGFIVRTNRQHCSLQTLLIALLPVMTLLLLYYCTTVHCLRDVTRCRDDAELQTTFKQKMTQTNDVCTLTVAGVTTKMSGKYRCVASNVAGTAECSAVVSVVGKQRVLRSLSVGDKRITYCTA